MITISSIIITIIFIASLMLLFIDPQLSKTAINSALNLSASSVIPALFPCFVLTNIWILTGHAQLFSKKVGGICSKLFHLPPVCTHAFLIGCLGGFPAGSKALLQLYDQRLISKEEAEQALLFCNNASPGFVIGFVGDCLFQNAFIGLALWIIHIISALILGLLFRSPTFSPSHSPTASPVKRKTLPQSVPPAIIQAGETTMAVCCTVMFFSLIATLISSFMPSGAKTNPWFVLLLGSIELVNGIRSLADFPQITAFILSNVLISWNGLCVHSQVLSSVQTPLSFKKYFLGKLYQIMLSTIIACIVSSFLPLQSSCAVIGLSSEFHLTALIPFAALLLCTKTSSGKNKTVRI